LLTCQRNDGCNKGRVPPRVWQFIHILILVGIVLAIVAGVDSTDSSASTRNTGHTLRKAASILLFLVGLANGAVLLRQLTRIQSIVPGDRVLLWLAFLSMPFIFVRLLLYVLEAFLKSAAFNPLTLNIYIEAFMQILMEFIAIALYIAGGLLAPVMDESQYRGDTSELLPSAHRYSRR